jgi:hypothetical protein
MVEKRDLNYIFGIAICIYKDINNEVYQFDLENMIDNTLLLSNLVFNPNQFNTNKNIQIYMVRFYELLKNIQVTGGSNKNLKNKTLKHKHNKMKGGTSVLSSVLQDLRNNRGQNQNEITYVNEINGVSQINLDKDNPKLELRNEPSRPDNNPEYIPNPEITKNLGKSVYQIFFEELEKKPEIFNSFFEKKECEPCAIPEQESCKPCHKAELITRNIKFTCPGNNALNALAPAAAGGSIKSYVIHHCKETKRKYIRKSNTR